MSRGLMFLECGAVPPLLFFDFFDANCLRTPIGRQCQRWNAADALDEPAQNARLHGVPDFPLVGKTIQQLWDLADAGRVPAIAWINRHVLTPLFESISPIRRNG